jgi:hypothetical protein
LIDARGRRPSASYRSELPVNRDANSPRLARSPRQKSRGVAVAAVPLRPQRGEAADLVAALADVPRLGDELDLADHRVLVHQVEERRQPVDRVELPGECGSEVEPEPVDVHLGDPVPQRIHDQPQRLVVADVEAVPGAGRVVVVLRVARDQPVVGLVVDPAERQRRPQMVPFGGVVVDHVEDHLDARAVQRPDHRLELEHLLTARAEAGVVVVRGEEADGVVAPVVRQPPFDEHRVVHELVHRHQLDGRDPELPKVVDHHRVRQARVAAADVHRDARMAHRHPFDVRLVDHRLVVGDAQRPITNPVEERVDHHRGHGERAGVGVVAGGRIAEPVGEQRLVPVDAPVDRLRIRVQQQLRGVTPQPRQRVVGPMHAVAVPLPGPDPRQVAVPHEPVPLRKVDPRLPAVVVDQTELDPLRDLREQGEVGTPAVEGGTQRVRGTGPDVHKTSAAARAQTTRLCWLPTAWSAYPGTDRVMIMWTRCGLPG